MKNILALLCAILLSMTVAFGNDGESKEGDDKKKDEDNEPEFQITSNDIYDAIERIQIGLEKKGSKFSKERQKMVAYHEGGHALLGVLMEEYDMVNKISIVPRGPAGGVTIFTP